MLIDIRLISGRILGEESGLSDIDIGWRDLVNKTLSNIDLVITTLLLLFRGVIPGYINVAYVFLVKCSLLV
jgi:hypothetical protein